MKLIQSLRLVASPFETQLNSFPPFTFVPDEIALVYDDAYFCVMHLNGNFVLSTPCINLLIQLDKLFEEMTAINELWELDKLNKDTHWEEARKIALAVLEELNEKYERPDISLINWAV